MTNTHALVYIFLALSVLLFQCEEMIIYFDSRKKNRGCGALYSGGSSLGV